MISFIPGPLNQYRRHNPYTHPVLFFVVDSLDAFLQLLCMGALAYAAYAWFFNGPTTKTSDQFALQSVSVPGNTTEILASSTSSSNPGTVLSKPKTVLDGKHGILWVNTQPLNKYTIQFGASTDQTALVAFADANLPNGAVIYPFKRTNEGNVMYGVASGLYESLPAALRAIEKMPPALVSQDPWIRQIEKLQSKVQAAGNKRT